METTPSQSHEFINKNSDQFSTLNFLIFTNVIAVGVTM